MQLILEYIILPPNITLFLVLLVIIFKIFFVDSRERKRWRERERNMQSAVSSAHPN